jgi:hypothetical protein
MASEIRVNQIQNRSGLGTVTFSDTGVSIAGVTTVGILSATGNSVFSGNVTVSGTISGTVNTSGVSTFSGGINVGNTFLRATSISIGATDTVGRNAGVGTASGTIVFNSTSSSVQVYTGPGGWAELGGGTYISATGGNIVRDYQEGGTLYRSHIFTSSGTFTVNNVGNSEGGGSTVEYLLVAGGGSGGTGTGGGFGANGGGGAGGVIMGKGFPVTGNPTSYTITIGSGASGIAASPGSGGATGNNGTDSQFGSLYASGGGAGAGHGNGNARPGGSGGGAAEIPGTNAGLGNVPFSYGIIQGYPGGGSPLYPNTPGAWISRWTITIGTRNCYWSSGNWW